MSAAPLLDHDGAFTDPFDTASTMALAVALELGPRVAELELLEATREGIAAGLEHG